MTNIPEHPWGQAPTQHGLATLALWSHPLNRWGCACPGLPRCSSLNPVYPSSSVWGHGHFPYWIREARGEWTESGTPVLGVWDQSSPGWWVREGVRVSLFHFPGGSESELSACNVETGFRSLGWEDPLEKETATHSNILAWKTPWAEEPSRL